MNRVMTNGGTGAAGAATADLNLVGELDADTVTAARRALYELIDAHPGETLQVELTGLEFIDSTGLGLLVGALKKARMGGGELVFGRPRDHLWRVFTVTGLDTALPFAAA
jgi:anti-sigma B factor antagonist